MAERGRPKHYYIGDREPCRGCYYFKKHTNAVRAITSFCDFCEMEGHSRIYSQKDIGRRMVKKGFCDKYKPKGDNNGNKESQV